MAQQSEINIAYFYDELRKKVSDSNARLLIHAAVVRSGISYAETAPLDRKDAQALCMALINSGGPGFQVGRAVYNHWVK